MKKLAILLIVGLLAACQSAPNKLSGALSRGYMADGVTAIPGTQADLETNIGDRVFFPFDSSSVDAEGQATLSRQAAWLKAHPDVSVVIEGHTDSRGTGVYNLALGERRANSVKNILVSHGIDSSRVSTISYGKERPAVLGENEEAWAQNRRGVTIVNQ